MGSDPVKWVDEGQSICLLGYFSNTRSKAQFTTFKGSILTVEQKVKKMHYYTLKKKIKSEKKNWFIDRDSVLKPWAKLVFQSLFGFVALCFTTYFFFKKKTHFYPTESEIYVDHNFVCIEFQHFFKLKSLRVKQFVCITFDFKCTMRFIT